MLLQNFFSLYADFNFCSLLSALRQKSLEIPPSSSPLSLPFPLSKTNYTAPFLLSFMFYLTMKPSSKTFINTGFMSIPLIITHFLTQLLHPFSPLFYLSLFPLFHPKILQSRYFQGSGKECGRKNEAKEAVINS